MGNTNSYIGSTIGNYRILAELGSGSFGVVYRCEHVVLHNRVGAIKLLHAAHLDSRQDHDSFLLEARLLEMLKHPHIVPILDVGIQDGFPYLVTEYAPLGSLRDRQQRIDPRLLPMDHSLKILAQVGQALDYAHQQNIIHRDLKPANILFNVKGDALLADFGIATTLATASIKFVDASGSPPYMAPEQFQGTVSKESDQYSLGCIAYELFTGHRPFSAPDPFAIGFKHLTEAPVPPTRLNPNIPSHIEQAILKAMAKERTDRYPTIAAFVTALQSSPTSQSQPAMLPEFVTDAPTLVSSSSTPMPVQQQGTRENIFTEPSPNQYIPAASASPMPIAQEMQTLPTQPVSAGNQAEMQTLPPYASLSPIRSMHSTSMSEEDFPTVRSQREVNTPYPNPITPPPFVATGLVQEGGAAPLPPMEEPFVAPPTRRTADNRAIPPNGRGAANAAAKSNRRRRIVAVVLVAFALLLIASSVVYALNGGSPAAIVYNFHPFAPPAQPITAKVTLTPIAKDLKKAYTISLVTGQPDASQDQASGARLLYSSPATQSEVVSSTGSGSIPAVRATGSLTFSNFTGPITQIVSGTQIEDLNNKIIYVTTSGASVHQGSPPVTLGAYASTAGTSGNIPPYDINSNYCYTHTNLCFNVDNSASFTGGQNAQSYPILEQYDINNAVSHLTSSAYSTAYAGVQSQIGSHEQLYGSISCSRNYYSSQNAGAHVSSATVSVTENCRGEVYDTTAALALAQKLLKHDVTTLLGAGYSIHGAVKTQLGKLKLLDDQGTIAASITADALAIYQFTDAQKQAFAKLIVGETSALANATLQKETGIAQVMIQISGNPSIRLPDDPANITFIVLSVQSPNG